MYPKFVVVMFVAALAACGGKVVERAEEGPAGPAGEDGEPGMDGAPGEDGMDGAPGVDGADGMDGAPGAAGAAGADGAAGAPGADGADGADGTSVIVGADAKQGLDISPVPVDLTGLDSAQIEMIGRGSYFVNAVGACNDCHANLQPMGPPRFLGGGLPFDLGGGSVVYGRNLTPDPTTGMSLTEAEFVNAMRTGRDYAATGDEMLFVMPWFAYRWLTEDDIKSIYAYLQAIPPVDNAVPADIKGALAGVPSVPFPATFDEGDIDRPLSSDEADPEGIRRGYAISPVDHPADLATQSIETQRAYLRGSYLVNAAAACNDCHTNPMRDFTPGPDFLSVNTAAFLTGGAVFQAPPPIAAASGIARAPSKNLIGENNAHRMSLALWLTTMTEGTHFGGAGPVAWPMPWMVYRNMTTDDLVSIYTYLELVPTTSGAGDKVIPGKVKWCAADTDCDTAGGESCDTAAGECIGAACATDADCPVCQTCSGAACVAPTAGSACLTDGI